MQPRNRLTGRGVLVLGCATVPFVINDLRTCACVNSLIPKAKLSFRLTRVNIGTRAVPQCEHWNAISPDSKGGDKIDILVYATHISCG